ncbi:MAG TPA: hypothetical protein VHQ41_02435 [Patescibacteria group bacterium]|nr:hypothetical protein [Patescibacteria group bacterium]
MPLHQCYWNDRLVIAVMCRLPWKLQQRAAWCAANNGLIGYWEWQTHFGFSTAAVLEKLEIPLDLGFSTRPSPANSMYYLLDRSIVVALAKHFDLPTQKFRDDFEPDENTNDRLKELWTDYFPANGAYQLERPK